MSKYKLPGNLAATVDQMQAGIREKISTLAKDDIVGLVLQSTLAAVGTACEVQRSIDKVTVSEDGDSARARVHDAQMKLVIAQAAVVGLASVLESLHKQQR